MLVAASVGSDISFLSAPAGGNVCVLTLFTTARAVAVCAPEWADGTRTAGGRERDDAGPRGHGQVQEHVPRNAEGYARLRMTSVTAHAGIRCLLKLVSIDARMLTHHHTGFWSVEVLILLTLDNAPVRRGWVQRLPH